MFLLKITIASSCEVSSILPSVIIDVESIYNYPLNVIISLGPIPCFCLVTRMLYILKVIIEKNTTSDCGWSKNSIHS